MELELLVPDVDAWRGGDRWFRCELLGMVSLDYSQAGGTDMSFRGVLAKPTALSVRCITWLGRPESGSNFEPVPCASPHRGEYVGAYTAPVGPWPATAKQVSPCRVWVRAPCSSIRPLPVVARTQQPGYRVLRARLPGTSVGHG
jgi:hypothetical protein